MNRNFGKNDEHGQWHFAPERVTVDGVTYWGPQDAALYAQAEDGPWLPYRDEKPTGKVGVDYVATETRELRDGVYYRVYDERPIVAPPVVYIVEEIIYQLIAVQKLQATKAVVGDYWELLTMRERIDATNEYWAAAFPQVCAGLIAAGVFASQDEIDALLAKCREGYIDEDSGREVR